MSTHTLGALALLLALSACGGSDAPAADPAPATEEAPAPPAADPAASAAVVDGTVTLTPVGEEMRYAITEITAVAGETVRLVFNNTATSAAMSHNVVVLRSRDDITSVGQAAMQAVDTDYIPTDLTDRIVAYTPMAAPGQTVEVTFTAPDTPGEYPYICTFPGHFAMMQGVLRVTAATPA